MFTVSLVVRKFYAAAAAPKAITLSPSRRFHVPTRSHLR